MRLMLIKRDKIYDITLPKKKYGVYYLEDKDKKGNSRKLLNIEASDNSWKITSNSDAKLLLDKENYVDSFVLNNYNFYRMYISNDKEIALLYASPFCDNTQILYKVKNNGTLLIGNDNTII